MNLVTILLMGFTATSAMTLFSYIVSWLSDRQFREPQLLNVLLDRSNLFNFNVGKSSPAGWVIHYVIGFLFVIAFNFIWQTTGQDPSLESGAYLGYLAGIIGITGWKIFFILSPRPPKIAYDKFYIQLIIAHITFGLGAALVVVW